ncbi:uncharacterized protein LOC144603125 isoform X1 [Rhinoraja longicauda]
MLVVRGKLPNEKFDHTFFYNMAFSETSDIIKRVSVTLDVETAHPELEVSEDRKRVRWTRTERSLLDTGKRFTGRSGTTRFGMRLQYDPINQLANQYKFSQPNETKLETVLKQNKVQVDLYRFDVRCDHPAQQDRFIAAMALGMKLFVSPEVRASKA